MNIARHFGQASASMAIHIPSNNDGNPTNGGKLIKEPLQLKGVLDEFKSLKVTPILGTEFPDAHVSGWLRAPNSDDLIRDLAITISQRGVVFFRSQTDLTDELQKELGQRLGELSGKPFDSTLHIHPLTRYNGDRDVNLNIITSDKGHNPAEDIFQIQADRPMGTRGSWHTDIGYEPHPCDFTILKLVQMPETGGDTLWASSYELYDRISPAYRKFLEGLTATMAQSRYAGVSKEKNIEIYTEPRGNPANVGLELKTVHPLIRTNPVTGWKGLFGVGTHLIGINEVTPDESHRLHDWLLQLIVEHHDCQLRHRWHDPYDIAIWDNRSVLHTAILDHGGLGPRTGHRVVGVGERPYLDPNSKTRREALAEAAKA